MSLHLILGDDPILIGEAVSKTVDDLVGDGDRGLMLEVLGEGEYRNDEGGHDPLRLVDAARTPPFLTDKRVVVGRHVSRFSRKDDYGPLVSMLAEPMDTTDLVLVWEKGVEPKVDKMPALPKALKEAIEVAGGIVVKTAAGRGKEAGVWLRDQLGASDLEFDRDAVAAIEDLIGDESGRLVGILRTLEGALGAGATVTADDVATYGGTEKGGTVPWALDDAVDKGDVAGALELLTRLIPYDGSPADRNGAAFRLMATLQRRYGNMLRLDGAGVGSDKQAAELLGMKGSTFPAKKALGQSRKLGTEKLSRAIELLHDADMALRGTVDWPPELVMEVLVARLASLSGRR
ncbi:MAG: DNA polymerase III subunit delta [Actinomycetota bacterium]